MFHQTLQCIQLSCFRVFPPSPPLLRTSVPRVHCSMKSRPHGHLQPITRCHALRHQNSDFLQLFLVSTVCIYICFLSPCLFPRYCLACFSYACNWCFSVSKPDKFDGSLELCRGFLLQCSLFFSNSPPSSDGAWICLLYHTLLVRP